MCGEEERRRVARWKIALDQTGDYDKVSFVDMENNFQNVLAVSNLESEVTRIKQQLTKLASNVFPIFLMYFPIFPIFNDFKSSSLQASLHAIRPST